MNGFKMYFSYLRMCVKSSLQYRQALWFRLFSQLLYGIQDCFSLFVLFGYFGSLGSWSLWEAALLYAVTSLAFALAELILRGFDIFPNHVREGLFDRLLVRPRSTFLQVIGYRIDLFKIGRLLLSLGILIVALRRLPVLPVWVVPLCAFCVLCGMLLYGGLFMIFAAFSFWTVEPTHLVYIVTNGTIETSQFPIDVYEKPFQRFFTFVVPLACVNYYPMLLVLGRSANPLLALTPLAGLGFFALSLCFWNWAGTKYRSTGN